MNSLDRQRELQSTKEANNKARIESDAKFIKVPTRSSQVLSKEVIIGNSEVLANAMTMAYPAAGISISTGTSWGTSITDNSTNWNTAYSWGNHSMIGYWSGTSHPTTVLGYGITDGISLVGTPSNNQIAVWTGANTIEGTSGLTYDGSILSVSGTVTSDAFKTSSATAFTIEQSGTKLIIKYGNTTVLSISSAGLLTALDEVTAFGTP